MANRRYRSYRQEPDESYIPNITTGNMDLEMRIRQNQPSVGRFDYSKLEEDYPVTTIAEDFMIKERKRQEQRGLQEEINYRKSLIEDRASQLELKKAARDLDMYESQINREDAMLEQMPVARQKLAELDVRDPDFINKAYDIQEQHPMAFESDQFQKYIFQPMLNRNSRLTGRKQEGVVTQEGLSKAMGEISKYDELISARGEGVGPSPEEERYLGYLQNQIDETKETWFVEGGVCGFASVIIKPARGKFVTELKKRKIGGAHYYGGYSVSSWQFAPSIRRDQSYERACAAAKGAVEVLRSYG